MQMFLNATSCHLHMQCSKFRLLEHEAELQQVRRSVGQERGSHAKAKAGREEAARSISLAEH